MAKKKTKKIKKVEEVQEEEFVTTLTKKLWAVFGILLFLLMFYLLAVHITNKNSDDDSTKKSTTPSEVSISYNDIILGRSLDMSDDDYLVVCYDYRDEEINNTLGSLVSSYRNKEDGLKIYSIDMSSSFNKKYVGENANTNPSNVNDMVINGPTLMKISNHEVVDYIQGQSDIENYLG